MSGRLRKGVGSGGIESAVMVSSIKSKLSDPECSAT